MVSYLVVTTLEITLPLKEPKNPLERIATLAGPPRVYPRSPAAKFIETSPPPVMTSAAPNTRNSTRILPAARMGTPAIRSNPIAYAATGPTGYFPIPHRKPGLSVYNGKYEKEAADAEQDEPARSAGFAIVCDLLRSSFGL